MQIQSCLDVACLLILKKNDRGPPYSDTPIIKAMLHVTGCESSKLENPYKACCAPLDKHTVVSAAYMAMVPKP